MVRGLTIGSTDYRGQSLKDMLLDLQDWIKSLTETNSIFEIVISELEKKGYFPSADYNFRASCYDLYKFFDTAIIDLQEVIKGINSEVKEYHIKLLKNLGVNAHEKYLFHRRVWHEIKLKDYGDSDFAKMEELYKQGSDMTGDMIDLNNLVARLEDFVGMSRQDDKVNPNVSVNNNFYAQVHGMQQNYESKDIQQTLNYNSSNSAQIDELREILTQFNEYLQQSTSNDKADLIEDISDLAEVIDQENPKKNRVKSFGNSISSGMRKMLTMQSFRNVDEISTSLPNMIEKFNNLIDKF